MAALEDHSYLKICAQLASCLSISQAAARRKVELEAAKQGVKDLISRKRIAENLLQETKSLSKDKDAENTTRKQLDQLLEALAEDENFMVED